MEPEGSLPHLHVLATCLSLPVPFFILGKAQLGHKTRPGHCNMQHWWFSSDWSCMCVYWSLSFSTLFQSDLLPHLQSLFSIHASALCSWVPSWGTWEHKALARVRYKLLRWGNNLQSGVYYSKFLDFFPVWGEHSVNHGWLCTGEDVCQVCGHRPLLHQSTMGLAQEWTPPRQCAQGPSIVTKLQNESQVQLHC